MYDPVAFNMSDDYHNNSICIPGTVTLIKYTQK